MSADTGTKSIPLSSPFLDERDEEFVLGVLRSGRLSLGPSIDRSGVTSAAVPHMNTSSARYRSERMMFCSLTT